MAIINDQLYQQYLTRAYAYSPDKCFAAAQRALDESKTPVEKVDADSRTIWSKRAVAFQTALASGDQYAAVATVHTDEHRITLRVDGSGNQCSVHAIKYEVWHNNEKVPQLNITWTDQHVFRPFLLEVQDQLDRGP